MPPEHNPNNRVRISFRIANPMKETYRLSNRNIRGLYLGFSVIFLMYFLLMITSKSGFAWYPFLLIIIICYPIPTIGALFIYVTIDAHNITIPMGIFFRRSIPIEKIVALQLRSHMAGSMRDITIEYQKNDSTKKVVQFPNLTAFGTIKTAQMVKQLIHANPSIKIDSRISRLLSR